MKNFIAGWAVVVLVLAGVVGGQATRPVAGVVAEVWPEGKMPGRAATQPEGERPKSGDGVRRVTEVSRPTVLVFAAGGQLGGKGEARPAVVVCPGGGYGYVVMDKEGTEVAAWLNSAGVTVLVLKYRVPNNREGALQDVQRAISLARRGRANGEWIRSGWG